MQAQDRKSDFGSETSTQPAIFVGHGSPMVAIEFDDWNENLCNFIENLSKPSAIVVISAHWMGTDTIQITASRFPDQLYDFEKENYPDTLFHLTYPCEGQPKLASEIANLLYKRGHKAELDEERGLDHGTWVPLYVAFPNVDVPVVQISIPKHADPETLFDMGQTLASLRKRGILLMGSGNIVNNKEFADLDNKYADTEDWAVEIDEWVHQNLRNFEIEDLLNYKEKAPHVDKAISNRSHILPLFFVLGAMRQNDFIVNLFEGFHYGNISMRTFAMASNK